VAFTLSPEVTAPLVAYIIVGNAAFGFIAGYLYWKRGLECAIAAHMIAHITMIIGTSFA
jgi:membrane protease YdiL (CAAX protease family)